MRLDEQGFDCLNILKKEKKDTGSVEVQIAIFSEQIKNLTEHLKDHKHDYHTSRGLIKIVSKRKKLLSYLNKSDSVRHQAIIKKLGLRG